MFVFFMKLAHNNRGLRTNEDHCSPYFWQAIDRKLKYI